MWCPASRSVETAWVAAGSPIADQLVRLMQSSAADDQPVSVGEDRPRRTLGLNTVGSLRQKLAVSQGRQLLWRGQRCEPLDDYLNGKTFPPCNGPLSVTKLPRHWD
jgi:hypothetical protein